MGICHTCYDERDLRNEKEHEFIKVTKPTKEEEVNNRSEQNEITKENKPKIETKISQGQISNYIIAEIDIKDSETNKDIRIINSYEEYQRNDDFRPLVENKTNEKDIKDCEIRINNKLIQFNYFYKFKTAGKYTINYAFKNILPRTNYMFYKCEYLTKLDFSYFNNENSTTMEGMFCECSSLKSIIFSNFKTQNVTNMNHMFYGCSSLIDLDLSSFDTKNVTIMYSLFEKCKSLKFLNIANFNAEKVDILDMEYMFDGCDSLKLENIDTKDEKIKYAFSQENNLF